MIADRFSVSREIDKWSKQLSNYVLSDTLAGLVGKSPSAREKAASWTNSKDEWIASAGWQILSGRRCGMRRYPITFSNLLETIESDIHQRKNACDMR